MHKVRTRWPVAPRVQYIVALARRPRKPEPVWIRYPSNHSALSSLGHAWSSEATTCRQGRR